MMEGMDQAEKLFTKSVLNEMDLGAETLGQIARSVRKLLRDSLSRVDKSCRFKYKEFWLVIQKTAEKGKLIPEKAAEAFENLEKYFILLYKAPWKREFRKLKTYCGFFQSKIRSHLEDPESIICLVGFVPEGSGTLVLKGEADLKLLISVAFQCVVAVVECEMISEFHRRMKENGANVADVVRWRETGEMPEKKKLLSEHDSGAVIKGFTNSITMDSAYGSANQGAGNVRQKAVVIGAEGGVPRNLPFIDEDDHTVDDTGYVEGTIDEHYMASLKWLSQSKSAPQKQEAPERPSSDDWAFVRDSLKQKYGQSYYDGVRGDVIRNPRENIRVRNNDDLSDEGIDIGEEPPAVNIQNPPVRIEQVPHRSLASQDRITRDSGYRTSSSQVYYPPVESLSSRAYQLQPHSPGVASTDTSAYVSQNSFRSHVPIVARGVAAGSGYSNIDRMAKKHNVIQVDNYRSPPNQYRNSASEFMARRMKDVGISEGDQWSCLHCTLLNNRQNLVCGGCGKSRDHGPEVDGPQCGDSITVCKQCTYENQPGVTVCAICGNPLDKSNLHTFV